MAVRGMPLTQLRAAEKLLPPSAGENCLAFCRGGVFGLLPGPSARTLRDAISHKRPQWPKKLEKQASRKQGTWNTRETQENCQMRALPGNQLNCSDMLPKHVECKRTSNAGMSRESTLLCWYFPKACKTWEKHQMEALLGIQFVCPDVFSKRVKHRRTVWQGV